MVKISVGGYDDGVGPSNRNQKRRREDEDDEEDEQPRSLEVVDPSNECQEHQDHAAAAPHDGSNGSATTTRDKSIPIFVSDPDVFDCCICYEPLSSPVFQCENGHIACSDCCVRIRNKCPMCFMPIGYSRCRAIEKVLDSIKISCRYANYGCKETFSYSKKNDHENKCLYLPCSCPLMCCEFVASSKELFRHVRVRHLATASQFTYDKFFPVYISVNDKKFVLQEKNVGSLFIVHNNHDHLGNLIRISCIGPKCMKKFQYEVLARHLGSTLILQSFTENIQGQYTDAPPSSTFLLVPDEFFFSGQLRLDICIMSQH